MCEIWIKYTSLPCSEQFGISLFISNVSEWIKEEYYWVYKLICFSEAAKGSFQLSVESNQAIIWLDLVLVLLHFEGGWVVFQFSK